MYLRETRRSNRDGSVVSYLQLAHNGRHPETGSPVAKVIHNFGRAEKVAQRSATTAGQKTILAALKLPEPPRFFDLTAASD